MSVIIQYKIKPVDEEYVECITKCPYGVKDTAASISPKRVGSIGCRQCRHYMSRKSLNVRCNYEEKNNDTN